MKSFLTTLLLLLIVSFTNNFAQTTHDVTLGTMTFSPDDLTITLNDIVKWTNTGTLHNVVADDGSFTSGALSNLPWTFEHTFTTTGDFRYYCENHGGPNGFGMSGIIRVQPATGVDDEKIKLNYKLKQNYPNPFNPSTTIEYTIPKGSNVTLKIYNVTGILVRTLISEFQPVGNYIVEFDASGFPSGMYFYQLSTGDFISTKRMILLK
jgi:plastocyanin